MCAIAKYIFYIRGLTIPSQQDNFTTAALEHRLTKSGVIVDEKTKALVSDEKKNRSIKQGSVASKNDSDDD